MAECPGGGGVHQRVQDPRGQAAVCGACLPDHHEPPPPGAPPVRPGRRRLHARLGLCPHQGRCSHQNITKYHILEWGMATLSLPPS